MTGAPSFEICWPDGETRAFTFDDLTKLPALARVADVSVLDARRRGTAIRLSALVDEAQAKRLVEVRLISSQEGFEVTLPGGLALEQGLVLYAIDERALSVEAGGPFRFLVPRTVRCQQADLPAGVLDNCANLKHLVRIEIGGGEVTGGD